MVQAKGHEYLARENVEALTVRRFKGTYNAKSPLNTDRL